MLSYVDCFDVAGTGIAKPPVERFRNHNLQDSESHKLEEAIDARQGVGKRPLDEKYQEKEKGRSWKNCGEELSKKARLELDRPRRSEEGGQGEPSQALVGVVLLVAKKLSCRSSELHKIVESLGGKISWSLVPSVTHFVFQGKTNDFTKEFKQAKQQGCKIISPDWLYKCRDENDKVSESLFPHNFNPRMKLNMTTDSSDTNRTVDKTIKTMSTNKSKPVHKRKPTPSLNFEEKMEEEEKEVEIEDTVPATIPATIPATVPATVPADVPAEAPIEISSGDDEDMKEISLDLAGLASLLENLDQTPVST